MIANVVAVTSGKGGVGKTTLSAGFAVHAARRGGRVLVVDVDPAATMSRDLGYLERSDEGRALRNALVEGALLEPLRGVRERLDVVPAGEWTRTAFGELLMASLRGAPPHFALLKALGPVAENYDLVIVDCPPYDALVNSTVMTAAHHLLLPSQADDGSIDGLAATFKMFSDVRASTNPDLDVLGVVLIPIDSRAKRLKATVAQALGDLLGEHVPVFETSIRYTQPTAVACRAAGLVAVEYADLADSRQAERYRELRGTGTTTIPATTSAVRGLAEDFTMLGDEILAAITARKLRETEAEHA